MFKPLRCKDYVIVNWLFWEQTSHFKILHQWAFYSLTNNWRNNHQINLLWKSFDADAFWIRIFFFFSVLHIFSHLDKIWYIIYLRDLKKIHICFSPLCFPIMGQQRFAGVTYLTKYFITVTWSIWMAKTQWSCDSLDILHIQHCRSSCTFWKIHRQSDRWTLLDLLW